MHAAFFEVKTAHLSAQVVARPLARQVGLTPARFDLLFAVKQARPYPGRRQDELARMLHVSTSNVSRMVRALVRLGWIERQRDRDDGRTWRLRLTERAQEVFNGEAQFPMKGAYKAVRRLMCNGESVVEMMIRIEELIYRFRRMTGRPRTLLYPYGHPDD